MRLDSKMIEGNVTGPYEYKGRRWVTIERPGYKANMTYSRFLMQEHLGRVLGPEEHVDHVDEDRLNDTIDNYQILSPAENTVKSKGQAAFLDLVCEWCGGGFVRLASLERGNRKKGKFGPFCGRSCAGTWSSSKSKLS